MHSQNKMLTTNLNNSAWAKEYGNTHKTKDKHNHYICIHNAGFFSCCSTTLLGIIHHSLKGEDIASIKLGARGMLRYCSGETRRGWNTFFEDPLGSDAISCCEHIRQFSRKNLIQWSHLEANTADYNSIQKELTRPIIETFFRPTQDIRKKAEETIRLSNADSNFIVGLYFRGTDKGIESELPTFELYNHLATVAASLTDESNPSFFIQSDQEEFVKYISECTAVKGFNTFMLPELQPTTGHEGVHNQLSTSHQIGTLENYIHAKMLLTASLVLSKTQVLCTNNSNVALWGMLYSSGIPCLQYKGKNRRDVNGYLNEIHRPSKPEFRIVDQLIKSLNFATSSATAPQQNNTSKILDRDFFDTYKTCKNNSNPVAFSIITINYNNANGLKKTIESVACQAYTKIEHLIVDGESTDESVEIIREYTLSHKNARALIEKDNGKYDAMNKAIYASTGRYLIFINSGDELFQQSTLSDLYQAISRLAIQDQDKIIYFGNRQYVNQRSGVERIEIAKSPNSIFSGMFCGHQSIVYPRSSLINHPYNSSYDCAGDYDQLLRLHTNGYFFQRVDQVLSRFYGGGESESGLIPHLEAVSAQISNGMAETKVKIKSSRYYAGLCKHINQISC